MTTKTIEHAYLDIYLDVADDEVMLRFGPDIREEDIPVDGEFVRVGGLVYKVGIMDTSDPPLLHRTKHAPPHIWWDADDACSVAASRGQPKENDR